MKGQHLFYGFLPGVTAAVLTTQPAMAETMKVNRLQFLSSPTVLATDDIRTLVAGKTQIQVPYAQVQMFPDIIANSAGTTTNAQFSSSHSDSVILTGNSGIDQAHNFVKDPVKTVNLKSDQRLFQRLKQRRLTSNQQQVNLGESRQELTVVVPNTTSPTALPRQTILALSDLQNPVTTNLKTQLPIPVSNVGKAKLLEISSCSLQTCQLSNQQQLAQANTQPSTNPTPVPTESKPGSTPPTQVTPTPVESDPGTTTQPTQPTTVTPNGAVQVPQNLIPNANPLQFPTKSQEVTIQENQPITLAQALELARRNNRDLQISLLTLQRSQQALKEQQAALLPSLNLSSGITRDRSTGSALQDEIVKKNGGSQNTDASTTFQGQAQLSYDLYTSGRRNATIQQAEEQLRFDKLDVERQSEDIRQNVATAYYNLQQADEQVRIARSSVANAQASLRDAEALERAGVGTRFDVLRSQVNLANSVQTLTTNLSQQATSRRQLATLLSLPQSVNISTADPVALAGLWRQSLEDSIILAYQNRPELHQQLAQRNISEQQRRQALANLGPQVSFIANYNLLDQYNDGVGIVDGYSVGVQARLNLYDGGASQARAAQAKTNIAIAETRFASQRDQVRFQVEQAFYTQSSSLENVQTSNLALEQAREALRLARLRFQAGVGTQTDVINSENDLTQAEGNKVTAILNYNRALVNLQRAVTSRALASQ